jgi:hypothetical protein
MPLLPHGIRFAQPRLEFRIDVVGARKTKDVDMIPHRERLDSPEPRTFEATREHHVSIEPPAPRRNLRERHADVKGDARLLRQYLHRSNVANSRNNGIEERTNRRRLVREVMLEIMTAARVRLIAVGELASAPLAPPQGWPRQRSPARHAR